MALRETNKIIHHGLNLASKVIESDTQVSTVDLNLLENLNTNQSLNYIKLEQNLITLEKNAKKYESLTNEFKSYQMQLESIETQVEKVSLITKELDNWSIELEEKVKKMSK